MPISSAADIPSLRATSPTIPSYRTVDNGDTGATPIAWELKLGPAEARPELTPGEDVSLTTTGVAAGCANAQSFTVHSGGRLIAAGITAVEATVTLQAGDGDNLVLRQVVAEDGCVVLEIELGNAAPVAATARSTQRVTKGDSAFQVDVGGLRNAQSDGDDCGGDYRRFEAIVVRLPPPAD